MIPRFLLTSEKHVFFYHFDLKTSHKEFPHIIPNCVISFINSSFHFLSNRRNVIKILTKTKQMDI